MMLRKAFVIAGMLGVATACTAVLGVEDVPPAPVLDASSSSDGGTVQPGTDATPGTDAGLDLKTELTGYATAYCTKYKSCSPPDFDYNYKDLEECVAGFSAGETWGVALPGIKITGQDYRDCATRTSALTCEQFGSSAVNAACALKGTRPADAKCLSNAQCASGFCSSDDDNCRGCIVPPDNGAKCAPGDQCGSGLTCVAGTCVAEATANQACSTDKPCAYPLQCLNSKCVPRIATAGAACGGANGECDTTKGFLCVSSKCTPFTISAPGAACGAGDAGFKVCRRNTKCTDNKCAEFPKEGEACDPGTGPNCLYPLRCINKKCTPLPPSSQCE